MQTEAANRGFVDGYEGRDLPKGALLDTTPFWREYVEGWFAGALAATAPEPTPAPPPSMIHATAF